MIRKSRWFNKVLCLSIGKKLLLLFSIAILFSGIISAVLFNQIYREILVQNVDAVSGQLLDTFNLSMEQNIENAASFSRVILSDQQIQLMLSKKINNYSTMEKEVLKRKIYMYLSNYALIDSVYLLDNDARLLEVGKTGTYPLRFSNMQDANWYKSLQAKKGGPLVIYDVSKIFFTKTKPTFITLMRQVNDFRLQKPIGIIMVNIRIDLLTAAMNKTEDKFIGDIAIFSDDGINFLPFKTEQSKKLMAQFSENNKYSEMADLETKVFSKYYITQYQNKNYNWRIINILPGTNAVGNTIRYISTFVFILIINIVFLILCYMAIFAMVSRPINSLTITVQSAQSGMLEKSYLVTQDDEIGRLKDGYNALVDRIGDLIEKVKEDQYIKRTAELNVLQSQIKPHFLYNTLDTARSFALSGKNEDVNQLLKSLGAYYRVSLSKGDEQITLKSEMSIVQNYLRIFDFRYGNTISSECYLEEEIQDLKILRFVLQPLVENAVHHGIRASGRNGTVKVTVKSIGEKVQLIVEDNGCGMDLSMLETLNQESTDNTVKSFGLKSTIERLRIFYSDDNIIKIESILGTGTCIVISIPKERMC